MNKQSRKQSHKPRLALVIGSGGLKCAAALGVWQVLSQTGIPIDMAVGCSGGSLYAALIALGYGQEEAVVLTQQLWTADVARQRHWPSWRRYCYSHGVRAPAGKRPYPGRRWRHQPHARRRGHSRRGRSHHCRWL